MKKVILLDGGMGQELIKRSNQPPHPLWSAKILHDEPEIVEEVLDLVDLFDFLLAIFVANNSTASSRVI